MCFRSQQQKKCTSSEEAGWWWIWRIQDNESEGAKRKDCIHSTKKQVKLNPVATHTNVNVYFIIIIKYIIHIYLCVFIYLSLMLPFISYYVYILISFICF